jgi:signal transduction histidine kinase/CHASE3 domain sensor protein
VSLQKRARILVTLCVVLVLAGVVALELLQSYRGASNSRETRLLHSNDFEERYLLGMLNQETGLRGYSLTGDTLYLEPYSIGREQVAQVEPLLRANAPDAQQRRLYEAMFASARQWQAYAESSRFAVSPETPEGAPPSVSAGNVLFQAFRVDESRSASRLDSLAQTAAAQQDAITRVAQYVAFVGGGLALILLALLALVIQRSTLQPLARLSRTAAALISGEPTEIVGLGRKDEVGQLAKGLAQLQTVLGQRARVAATIEELGALVGREEVLQVGLRRLAELLRADAVTAVMARPAPGKRLIAGEFGSYVELPLVSGGKTVGTLAAARTLGRPDFSADDLKMGITLSDFLASAVRVAALIEESHRQVRQLTTLHAISVTTTGVLSPRKLAEAALRGAQRAFGEDVKGSVVWWDASRRRLWPLAATEDLGSLRWMSPGKGALGLAFSRKRPVRLADYHRWQHRQPQENVPQIRSVIAVPLMTQDRCVGALGVHAPQIGRFTADDVRMLSQIASQVAPALATAHVLEELRRVSSELESANRHKSEFLAHMSHELRTPLNAVLGFSELLLNDDGRYDDTRRRRYLDHIRSSGKHLLNLIGDVLDLARVESGHLQLEPVATELRDLVNEVVAAMEPLLTAGRLELNCEVADSGPLMLDRRKIHQVLLNLLSNAIKFTPEGGLIRVEAAEAQGWMRVAVQDTGIGIAEEDQVRIFEPFEQIGDARLKGTGLGLALSKRFVELHGGRIWVESEFGQGSRFIFELPLEKTPVATAA